MLLQVLFVLEGVIINVLTAILQIIMIASDFLLHASSISFVYYGLNFLVAFELKVGKAIGSDHRFFLIKKATQHS